MKTKFILLTFSLCFFFNCSKAQTPTILGGNISYECVGLHTYAVSLNVYADCLGAALPDSVSLNWSSSCQGTSSGTLRMPKITGFPVDVTGSIFPGASGSSCSGGSGARGVEHYLYVDTLVLAATCPSINLSWLGCCRNDSLTSIVAPSTTSFYLETTLGNLPVACNSSVSFLNYPIIASCVGFPSVYNQGAVDPDGDSLRYALIPCYEGANNPVNYFPGYAGVAPFGAWSLVTIDPQTGEINYTVPANQTSMFCVLVEEIRGGVVISSTIREIAIIGLNCPTNNLPIITGIDSTNSYDTTVLVGQSFCFDIHGEDLDVNQQLLMSWNNGIAGATFTIDTSSNPIGTFCWTPTAQDTGQHAFVVEVTDSASPIPGVAIEGFTIQVNTALGIKNKNQSIQNAFKIYPNPARHMIQISFDAPIEEGFDFKIIDAQGKLVYEQLQVNETKPEVAVQHLTTGLYSVLVINKKGQVLEQKLIVR
jgi:hypothetical protein